jgi:hypothetical protein
MSKMTLEAAARAEHAAERNRSAAEQRWRQMWWATTRELAKLDSRQDVTAAYDAVARILGQNRSYLSKRRMAGLYLSALEGDGLETLPPRLAMEYVTANGNPSDAARYLRDAEERGVSLRDLAAELGTQPKSWLREDEQSQRPVAEAAVGAALTGLPAQARGDLIREMLSDPEVAEAAFNRADAQQRGSATQAALGNIAQASHRGEMRRQEERRAAMTPGARGADDDVSRVGAKLDLDEQTLRFKSACTEFIDAVSAALPQAGPYAGGTGAMSYARLVSQTADVHETSGRILAILGEYVASGKPGTALDDALAEMLSGQGNG